MAMLGGQQRPATHAPGQCHFALVPELTDSGFGTVPGCLHLDPGVVGPRDGLGGCVAAIGERDQAELAAPGQGGHQVTQVQTPAMGRTRVG